MLVKLKRRSPLTPIRPGDLVLFLPRARLMLVAPFVADTEARMFHQLAQLARIPPRKHSRRAA